MPSPENADLLAGLTPPQRAAVTHVDGPLLILAGAAQRQVAAVRIALDKARKKLKEDVLERGRQIDGQAKPLFARVAEIEEPIDAQIEAFKPASTSRCASPPAWARPSSCCMAFHRASPQILMNTTFRMFPDSSAAKGRCTPGLCS